MRQPKKIFTRMLLNHWGGIDHQVIHFHEYVNLFSGKSGSGKSTVMDAMQVVLYGSVRNDFFNKAADDTKNRRSVLSYLRGEQKDGTANRENQDFNSQIVLEILDTGKNSSVCVGVAFQVMRGDMDLKEYHFFSHTGKMPQDEYLKKRIPYSFEDLTKLISQRKLEDKSKSFINLNRTYQTNDSYLTALNDVILGYVDAGRFKTMQKSAIALRMTNGTGQFIKDYMFPKSKEDTISAISEQLAAYREIKEQVETLETQIEMLEEIREHDLAFSQARADQIIVESFLKILDIEDKKAHLEAKKEDLSDIQSKIESFELQSKELKETLTQKREIFAGVQADLKSTEFEKKKEAFEKLKVMIQLCGNEAADFRELLKRLRKWEETEGVSDYVSNLTLNLLEDFYQGNITPEKTEKLKRGLKEVYDVLNDELDELRDERKSVEKEYREKKEILEDLKSDKKHYKKELKEARKRLQDELSTRYRRTIHVEVLADLFDVTDEGWRNAIEGRLGRIKFGLVVEPRFALEAAKIFREMKKREFEMVDLINTQAIERDNPQADKGTLYDAVSTEISYVDLCLKRYLGRIKKCRTVEGLHEVRDGVTPDCYSYSNYMFRHLREADYRYPSIGRKISPKQIKELEDEIWKLSEQLIALEQEIATLKQAEEFERLQNYEYEKIVRLLEAREKLVKYNQEADELQQEIRELERGTLIAELKKKEELLTKEINELEGRREQFQNESVRLAGIRGKLENDIEERENRLKEVQEGFFPNKEQKAEVLEIIANGKASYYKHRKEDELSGLREKEETESNLRINARNKFNKTFPSFDFSGMEKENTCYDELLEKCKTNFEPQYKDAFDKQYQLVYKMLRENVIATIHGEIKGAKRHRREINAMLYKIRFSDSVYQIDILPTDDENRQFYEMLTAEELDMKVVDGEIDGQLGFLEDAFYQKYEAQIKRLTEKFMPPREADQATRSAHKKNMEKYADYRTYLKFSMYEQSEDAAGNIKKNYVDDMAGRDSGGEGQNPKYVALMAGFAMLYMQQSNRDSKIRVVMLDEAFSKMDKERSEVCLHYARQLGLQLVVCVPDERLQSLIRNVDCVYAFRRANNRISMIHIDKGDYFRMIEGENEEEENGEEEDTGNRENSDFDRVDD